MLANARGPPAFGVPFQRREIRDAIDRDIDAASLTFNARGYVTCDGRPVIIARQS
jgi:hypothetical protein